VDSDGDLQVDVAGVGAGAGLATEATLGDVYDAVNYINLGQHLGTYRKLSSATGSSGNLQIDLSAIGAGYLLVVENLCCYLSAGTATGISAVLVSGASVAALGTAASPAVRQELRITGAIVVAPGENLRFYATGVGANTTLNVGVVGHYVRTA